MRHRPNRFRVTPLLFAAVALAASGVATRADQVVYFVNGKAMTVKKVEKGDRLTILEIEGGGRIGIPTVQIDRIEELTLSAAAAPPVAAQAILPTPPPQTQAVNQVPPPPATQLPAGPGTGGHVTTNTPAGGVKPLAFGGDKSEEGAVAARPRPTGQSTQQGGGAPAMMPGQAQRGNMMMGGPGARGGRQGGRNFGKGGRLPSGAYLPPKDPGAAGQTGQAGAAGQPPPPSATAPAPPPASADVPPPPPPPDPTETDPGSSEGPADDGSTPETGNDTPGSDDGGSGQN